jgi:molybdopterin-guanine dinucleotide biosynthesis protein MobB
MLSDLPILGVCGWSGSGKTTLIEALVGELCSNGLTVAVLKHDVHGLDVDKPGKDSDRLFRAGADVFMKGTGEEFMRSHPSGNSGIEMILRSMARRYDLVLVEGHKQTLLPKLWLLRKDEVGPPEEVSGIVQTLAWDTDRFGSALNFINDWLPAQWRKTPVYGCVLIGGGSTRMGRPKHLIEQNGRTWLERTVELLQQACERVVISGGGQVPQSLAEVPRIPDVTVAKGPMAGILAAMRWAPYVSWLVTACDLPDLSKEALEWLISTRAPGVWATLPKLEQGCGAEPLLAHYDFRSHDLIEKLAAESDFRLHRITSHSNIFTPTPSSNLAPAWRNVNTEVMQKSQNEH